MESNSKSDLKLAYDFYNKAVELENIDDKKILFEKALEKFEILKNNKEKEKCYKGMAECKLKKIQCSKENLLINLREFIRLCLNAKWKEGLKQTLEIMKTVSKEDREFFNFPNKKVANKSKASELCNKLLQEGNKDIPILISLREHILTIFISKGNTDNINDYNEILDLVPSEQNTPNTEFIKPLINHLIGRIKNDNLLFTLPFKYLNLILDKLMKFPKPEHLYTIFENIIPKLKNPFNETNDNIEILIAISKILNLMAETNLKELPPESIKNLKSNLDNITGFLPPHSDTKVNFYCWYTRQALRRIPCGLNGFENLVSFISDTASVVKNLLTKNTKELYKSYNDFKIAVNSYGKVDPAYDEIRFATFLKNQKNYEGLEEFIKFSKIEDQPSIKNPDFTAGIVYLLEEILFSEDEAINDRESAFKQIIDIFKENSEWKHELNISETLKKIKVEILKTPDILVDFQKIELDQIINNKLQNFLSDTCSSKNIPKGTLYELAHNKFKKEDLDYSIYCFKNSRLEELKEKKFNEYFELNDVYTNKEVSLMDILESNYKVMLIKGDTGSGKSTLSKYIEKIYWDKFEKIKESFLPVAVDLSYFDSSKNDFLSYVLKDIPSDLKSLINRKEDKFIFILDGYDELNPSDQKINYYNLLKKKYKYKNFKIIILSHPVVVPEEKDNRNTLFKPEGNDNDFIEFVFSKNSNLLNKKFIDKMCCLILESDTKLKVEESDTKIILENCKQYIKKLKEINFDYNNPLMLKIILEFIHTNPNFNDILFNFYKTITDNWIKYLIGDKNNYSSMSKLRDLVNNIDELIKDSVKSLCQEIYKDETNKNLIIKEDCLKNIDNKNFKKQIDSNEQINLKNQILKFMPTCCELNERKFLHESIFHFYISQNIIDEINNGKRDGLLSIRNIHYTIKQFIQQEFKDNNFINNLRKFANLPREYHSIIVSNAETILIWAKKSITDENLYKEINNLIKTKLKKGYYHIEALDTLCYSISYNNGILAVQQLDRILIYKISNNESVYFKTLKEKHVCVKYVAVSPSGNKVASVCWNEKIKRNIICLWDIAYNMDPIKKNFNFPINKITFSPDELKIAILVNQQIIILNLKENTRIKFPSKIISSFAFCPIGFKAAYSSSNKEIGLWNIEKKQCDYLINWEEKSNKNQYITYNVSGSKIISAKNKTMLVWDIENQEKQFFTLEIAEEDTISSLAINPRGDIIIIGCTDNTFTLIDLRDKNIIRKKIRSHSDEVTSISFINNENFATASKDNSVRFWNVDILDNIEESTGHYKAITAIAHLNHNTIVTGSVDNTIRIWEIISGINIFNTTEIRKYEHNEKISLITARYPNVAFVSFKKDEFSVDEFSVYIWNINFISPQLLQRNLKSVNSISFCPKEDKVRVIFDCIENNVRVLRIWNVNDNIMEDFQVNNLKEVVNSISFNSEGTKIVISSNDRTVRLLKFVINKIVPEPEKIISNKDKTQAAVFNKHGDKIAFGNRKVLYLWNLNNVNEPFKLLREFKPNPYSTDKVLISFTKDKLLYCFGCKYYLIDENGKVEKFNSEGERITCISVYDNHIFSGNGLNIKNIKLNNE